MASDFNPSPLYQQVYEEIKSDIEKSVYKVDEQIPTETQLVATYEVSRITIRRAIEKLCNEGYLVKKQGKGTFVSKPHIINRIMQVNSATSFTTVCKENGLVPHAKVESIQIVPPRPAERKFFNIDSTDFLIYIQRTRYADDMPIFEENVFVPYKTNERLMTSQLEDTSIFELLAEIHGDGPSGTEKKIIEAVQATELQAAKLDLKPGDPLLYLVGFFTDSQGKPLLIGRQYYVGARYRFAF